MTLRRILVPLILSVFVCLNTCLAVYAQGTSKSATYSNPLEVRLKSIVKSNFPDYFGDREALMPDNFSPIGWSKDGKFAFYTEPADEACGCYYAKLFIMDLKTDSVLWSFNFESEQTDEAKKDKKPYSLATLWRANRKLFSAKLNEFEIIQQRRFAMMSFPFMYKGDVLKTDLGIAENTDEESRPYGIVDKATLRLSSKRSGMKTPFETSYPDAKPLEMKVLGLIKSPYEQRIAVVLMEVYRGYEGPPHTGHVKIAGATLATGFK